MQSMTGFGQAAGEGERYRIGVSLRSVNHRYLDLALRSREELRELEPRLREILADRLARGRVEAAIELEASGPRRVEVAVDEETVAALAELGRDLSRRGLAAPELTLGDLLGLPEVLRLESRDPEWSDADRELLERLAGEALDQLIEARAAEGAKLHAALSERLDALGEIVDAMRADTAGASARLAAELERRIAELAQGIALDPARLAQEAAILADRSDVNEELDRLESHLEQFRVIMDGEGSLGKRLDFLAQEIFRELNTIASKCRDGAVTRRVIDGKALTEQIREQVQNVE